LAVGYEISVAVIGPAIVIRADERAVSEAALAAAVGGLMGLSSGPRELAQAEASRAGTLVVARYPLRCL
jgi:hypothetical protein